MKIGILGLGAMGTLFGVELGRRGHKLSFLSRQPAPWLAQIGLRLETPDGPRTAKGDLAAPDNPQDLDAILVFTKSFQTASAAKTWGAWLARAPLVASFQNGWGNAEILAGAGARVVLGSTAEGATRLGPGHALRGGSGKTYVAQCAQAAPLAAALADAGFDVAETPDGERILWEKLIVSTGINPVTAWLDRPNGALLERPDALQIAATASRETAMVAATRGFAAPFDPEERLREVAWATRENLSSMCSDLRRGGPTEVDAINGAVATLAQKLHLSVSVNECLWKLISAKTFVNQKREGPC